MTLLQTIFNSVNILIGVGLFSLLFTFKYLGWVISIIFFLYFTITIFYTAKLLAKYLDIDSSFITFANLVYVSFSHHTQIATSVLFTIELVATYIALIILFTDSLNALIPN